VIARMSRRSLHAVMSHPAACRPVLNMGLIRTQVYTSGYSSCVDHAAMFG